MQYKGKLRAYDDKHKTNGNQSVDEKCLCALSDEIIVDVDVSDSTVGRNVVGLSSCSRSAQVQESRM